jgi:hypothetical protein
MPKTSYAVHCDQCSRFTPVEKRYEAECPPERSGEIDGFPLVNWVSLNGTEYGEKRDGSRPYYDESLNAVIHSKAHKEEELKKRGLAQTDSGLRKTKHKSRLYFT